jgi:hypothetical protein
MKNHIKLTIKDKIHVAIISIKYGKGEVPKLITSTDAITTI